MHNGGIASKESYYLTSRLSLSPDRYDIPSPMSSHSFRKCFISGLKDLSEEEFAAKRKARCTRLLSLSLFVLITIATLWDGDWLVVSPRKNLRAPV